MAMFEYIRINNLWQRISYTQQEIDEYKLLINKLRIITKDDDILPMMATMQLFCLFCVN
jgi:hypothetical protein